MDFNDLIKEVLTWHLCSKTTPNNNNDVLVKWEDGTHSIAYYCHDNEIWMLADRVNCDGSGCNQSLATSPLMWKEIDE